MNTQVSRKGDTAQMHARSSEGSTGQLAARSGFVPLNLLVTRQYPSPQSSGMVRSRLAASRIHVPEAAILVPRPAIP